MLNEYYIFITLLLPQWANIIVVDLVNSGYTVKSGFDNIIEPNYKRSDPSALIVLIATHPVKVLTEVQNDLTYILNQNKIKIYSSLIEHTNNKKISTCGANFQLERKPRIDPKKIEHLRLIESPQEEKENAEAESKDS